MKPSEFIRIIVFSFIGVLLMFWVQPFFYRSQLLPFFALASVSSIDDWIGNYYIPGARIVLIASVIATLLWYFLAAKAQPRNAHDSQNWLLIWLLIFLFLPGTSIGIALYWHSYTPEAIVSLITLYIFDVALLYWFTTATSSPRALMYIPPGAFLLRSLFKD